MIQDFAPSTLQNTIAEYLRNTCESSYRGAWKRNHSDEDSVTASFFEKLVKEPDVMKAGGHFWEWGIEYSTTSSRGPKPLETNIGADVIFFIEIKTKHNGTFRKGLLIQSKIKKNMTRRNLEEQVFDMERFVPNCSLILGYEENQFRSATGPDYLAQSGKRWNSYSVSFCDFLADTFLVCKYGVENLYYDFAKNEVHYDDVANNRVLFVPERGASKIEIRQL